VPKARGRGPAPESLLKMLRCANRPMIVSVGRDELHPGGETIPIEAHRRLRDW
jgi:hypothetical protein